MNWYDDLCEYYGVTPEQAIELGARSKGRKPSFPSSKTCGAISGKTWEELWEQKPRDTLGQKFEFYKDIGAWSAFRQVFYRKDFNYRYFYNKFCTPQSSVIEYGCGVAPMTNYLVERLGDNHNMRFILVDVSSEHFEFAKWRLSRKAPNSKFKFVDVTEDNVLPMLDDTFDFICIMDVFEHLPNPLDVLYSLHSRCISGGHLVETWIDHKPEDVSEDDLAVAAEQRSDGIAFLYENFDLVENLDPIRIWRKK